MNTITLDWVQTSMDDLEYQDDTCFYAFARGRNLLYIGMTYDQTIQDEVKATINRFDFNMQGISIWLGYIDYQATTYQRITRGIIKDTECLLIRIHQPTYNTSCINNYTGRWNFRVVSRGSVLFYYRVSCDKNGILKHS